MRCLDIDCTSEWSGLYEPFFAELAPASLWAHLYDPEHYVSTEARLEALAKTLAPKSANPRVPLKARAKEFFAQHYTHVACYHSCRVLDSSSYELHGLRLSDIDELNVLAEGIFGPSEALSQAALKLRPGFYARYNHGKIGLFFARSGALNDGDHYLRGGSEYLRNLANELGRDARAKLETIGRPALVRCVMSLAELEETDSVGFAAMLPLGVKLTVRNPDAPPHLYAVGGGIMHPSDIPAAQTSIEYMDVSPEKS